jgi:hypothetical protein
MKIPQILLAVTALAPLVLRADMLLQEDFNYPDGQLSQAATNVWVTHSGGARALNVSGGAAVIQQADLSTGAEDVNRLLSTSFNPVADNATKLYAAFTVNFSALPISTGTDKAGSYFAHFKTGALNEYYARIGANLDGAAPGTFRLAIANENWTGATTIEYPQDLSLGVTYEVVVRLDLATDQSTLWVGPLLESSFSVTATDTITYAAGGSINAFALRQGASGIGANQGAPGILSLDNLRIATSFAELQIIPEPSPLALLGLGGAVLLVWRRRPIA